MANATERLSLNNAAGEILYDYDGFTAANGGAILLTKGSTLTTGGQGGYVFSNNSATEAGGAIYCRDKSIEVIGCTFEGNSAAVGGAIGFSSTASGSVISCIFDGNTASNKGGAIYLGASTKLTVADSDFVTASDTIYMGGASSRLYLEGTISLAASILEYAAKSTFTTLNSATLVFSNEAAITVNKLVAGTAVQSDSGSILDFNNSKALVNFTAQDLTGFKLVFTDDTVDSIQLGTGVTKVNADATYSDDYKSISFFSVDTAQNLWYNSTDTLKVNVDATKLAGDEFKSLDDLYATAADFAGNIVTTVAQGVTVKGYKKTKSIRGAYKDADAIGIIVDGTVTGSVMGAYAGANECQFGSTDIVINGQVDGYVIGGAYVTDGFGLVENHFDEQSSGHEVWSTMTLSGTLNDNVFGGSFVFGDGEGYLGATEIEVDGATQADGKYLLAGGMANGGFSRVMDANVYVYSDFGTVFGGGWAQGDGEAQVDVTTIELYDGKVDTVFAGGTTAKSGGISTITESAEIWLFGGSAEAIYLNGKTAGAALTSAVDVTLYVEAESTVDWIDGLTASGFGGEANTTIEINANLTTDRITHVDNWIIGNDCAIDFNSSLKFYQKHATSDGTEQFDNKINLEIGDDSYSGSGWTVMTTAGKFVSFNDTNLDVTLFGQAATFNGTDAFEAGGFSLRLSDDKKSIVLAQLA